MQITYGSQEKQEPILKWCYVAITDLVADMDELSVPIDLGNGVCLGSVPAWIFSEDITEGLGAFDRVFLKDARWALWKEYESSPVLGAQDPSSQNPRSIQVSSAESVMGAAIAFWIAGDDSILSYRVSVDAQFEKKQWVRRQFSTHSPFLQLEPRRRIKLDDRRLSRTRIINSSIASLVTSQQIFGAIWLALRNLTVALIQQAWHVRYPLMWIILESLFGPSTPGEITHRIALNVANFLGEDKSARVDIYQKMKRGYAWRSKIVHGRTLAKLDSDRAKILIQDTESIVRASMTKILSDPNLTRVFSGPDKDRESFLESLIFY